jgi:hypothetical protein
MDLREFAKLAIKSTMGKTIKDGNGATEKHIRQIAGRKFNAGENRGTPLVKK